MVAEQVNYTETADKLAQSLYDNIAAQGTVFKEGVLTGSSDAGDRARRDFIGVFGTKPLDGPIEGTVFAHTFGTTACAVTVITYQGAAVPHAQRRRR